MRKDRKTLARKSFLLAVAPEPVAHNVFVAARGHSTMGGRAERPQSRRLNALGPARDSHPWRARIAPHSLAFGVSSFLGRIASAALNSPKVWLT
jgi:hypothetical protein